MCYTRIWLIGAGVVLLIFVAIVVIVVAIGDRAKLRRIDEVLQAYPSWEIDRFIMMGDQGETVFEVRDTVICTTLPRLKELRSIGDQQKRREALVSARDCGYLRDGERVLYWTTGSDWLDVAVFYLGERKIPSWEYIHVIPKVAVKMKTIPERELRQLVERRAERILQVAVPGETKLVLQRTLGCVDKGLLDSIVKVLRDLKWEVVLSQASAYVQSGLCVVMEQEERVTFLARDDDPYIWVRRGGGSVRVVHKRSVLAMDRP